MDPRTLVAQAAPMLAFWVALLEFRRRVGSRGDGSRFALALLAGAGFAHLGWLLLYFHPGRDPWVWLVDPRAGASGLLVPLGVLALAPGSEPGRSRFLASSFISLPRALSVARLGCLAAGCCRGTPIAWLASPRPEHPTAVYEIVGLLLLRCLLTRTPEVRVPFSFCIGFGSLRLVVEAFRAPHPLGAPRVAASILALGWILVGLRLAWPQLRGRHRTCFGVRR